MLDGPAVLSAVPARFVHVFDDGAGRMSSRDVAAFAAALPRLDRDVPDAERVEQLAVLERCKAAICAAQARVTVDLDDSQRAALAAALEALA